MRVRPSIAAIVLVCLAASSRAAEPATAQVEYAADYVMETNAGAISGHVNVAPGKERREEAIEGTSMVTINRSDLKKSWMLMPAERMYMEMGAGRPGMGQNAPDPGDYQTEMTTVGPEELNGMQTVKSKVIMTGKDGSKMGGFWWSTAQGIVVKMDVIGIDGNTKMRMKRELSNIEIGPQDPALFEIPEGYQSMGGMGMGLGDMMGGAMGGRP